MHSEIYKIDQGNFWAICSKRILSQVIWRLSRSFYKLNVIGNCEAKNSNFLLFADCGLLF